MDREAGRHRSSKKKGRREAKRVPHGSEVPDYGALEASGFVIGQPRIFIPGERVK